MSTGIRWSSRSTTGFRIPSRVGPLLRAQDRGAGRDGRASRPGVPVDSEHGRVLVMIGVHSREPVVDVMRSRNVLRLVRFRWDGRDPGHVRRRDHRPVRPHRTSAPQNCRPGSWWRRSCRSTMSTVLIAATAQLAVDRSKSAGIRQIWVFQAFDDSSEVLMLCRTSTRGQRPAVDPPARCGHRVDGRTPASGSIRRCSSVSSIAWCASTPANPEAGVRRCMSACASVSPVTRSPKQSRPRGHHLQGGRAGTLRCGCRMRALPPIGARDHRSVATIRPTPGRTAAARPDRTRDQPLAVDVVHRDDHAAGRHCAARRGLY